jgi:hypothetical protein
VHAVREVSRRAGRRVSLVGHSQGALLATYAPQFWPDLPAKVDDVVGLAGPYQGTQRANESCADGTCPATSWQFRAGSNLNRAFQSGPRPAGPSFTSVATAFDELVTPAPAAARLDGARNVVVQDLCPGRPVEHFAIVGDAVAYALALDAITHPGPADPRALRRADVRAAPPARRRHRPRRGRRAARGGQRRPRAVDEHGDRARARRRVPVRPGRLREGRRGRASRGAPAPAADRTCVGGGRLRVVLRGRTTAIKHVTSSSTSARSSTTSARR